MKIPMKKTVQVDAKVLKIHMKVCDEFCASLVDQDGEEIIDHEGYVPDFMPGDHYGDYLILDIDIDSGQILNWEKPSPEMIAQFVNKDDDDE